MKKRTAALFMVLVLGLSSISAAAAEPTGGGQTEQIVVEQSGETNMNEQPEETGSPQETDEEQPGETGSPQETDEEQPGDTGSPQETNEEQPGDTGSPQETDEEQPEETGSPQETDEEQPGDTGSPQETNGEQPAAKIQPASDNTANTMPLKDDDDAWVNGDLTGYETVEKAIDANPNDPNIELWLQKDTEEDVVIPAGTTVTLHLDGHTLTNASSHTITNEGTLTIAGSGKIDNIIHGKGALYNSGAVVFDESCTAELTRSKENSGDNSWYVVYNAENATMKIPAAVSILSASTTSSCVCNWGYMEITGNATVKSDRIALKNDETGTLKVAAGTVSSYTPGQEIQAVQNWCEAELSGGTLQGNVISWGYGNNGKDYIGKTMISGSIEISGDVAAISYIEGNPLVSQKPSVTITGGSVGGELYKGTYTDSVTRVDAGSDVSEIVVSAGVFSNPVAEEFCADGLAPVESSDGSYTVEELDQENAAASIERGGAVAYYVSLADALAAAQNSDTIVLLKNRTENITIPEGRSVTLDLNGKTLSCTEPVRVSGSGTALTVQDSTAETEPVVSEDFKTVSYKAGKIINTVSSRVNNAVTLVVQNGASFTLESGILESVKNYTVGVYGNTVPGGNRVETRASITGGYQVGQEGGPGVFGNGAVLDISGGVIEGRDNSAVAGNGTTDNGGTEINISGGTLIGRIQTGGYLANALYHPQAGHLSITGGTLYADGGAAVVVRAGNASITGGTIVSTGTGEGRVGDSQIQVPSSGVVVDVKAGYPGNQGNLKVDVSGSASVTAADTVDAVTVILADSTPENEAKTYIGVSGGSFSSRVNANYCAGNYEPTGELTNGRYTVQIDKDQGTYVAEVGGVSYISVEAAAEAVRAGVGDTVKLLSNVTESIEIPADAEMILDLNGFTLTNTDKKHTIVNYGTLTIKDSGGNGRVDNVSHAKAAVFNEGTLSLESGTLTRSAENGASPSNNGGNSYYVAENKGVMKVSGGTITADGKYSSLIANKPVAGSEVSLTITGGVLSNGFITVKNEDGCSLEISGGTITSEEQAVQNWGSAKISGGTLNGPVIGWSYDDVPSETVISGQAVIHGDVKAVNYMNASSVPVITITGGTIYGTLSKGTHDGSSGIKVDAEDSTASVIQVSGGSFSNQVAEAFCAPGFVPTGELVDGMYTVRSETEEPEQPGEPEQPEKPEQPGDGTGDSGETGGGGSGSSGGSHSGSGSGSSAQTVSPASTGDETNLVLPASILLLAVCGLGICVAVSVRKKSAK